jgi:AhpD family alkylhydroperoxidase
MRVSQINHCRFCVDINSATLLKRGIGENQLWALEDWRASSLFSERERIALEYAEAITRSDLEVSDDLMARLKRQFDDDAIVELTALIAFQNLSSKFNAALDVPSQGFCRLPERAGSPAEPGRSSGLDPKCPELEQEVKQGS